MSKEVEAFVQANISSDVVSNLGPLFQSAADLREVVGWKEDSAHQRAHILDTKYIFHYLAVKSKLSQEQVDLGLRAIDLHDTGYRFVQRGLIPLARHHEGSVFYASYVDPDPRILKAIHHHIDDVLPADIEFWIRLVRDADRISVLGYSGANRLARFWGFKDPQLDELGDEEFIKRKLYCDLSAPFQPDGASKNPYYERNAYNYFQGRVTPYLVNNSLYQNFCLNMRVFLGRFYGQRNFKGVADIDPVCPAAQQYYRRRAGASDAILIHPSFIGSKWASGVVHNVHEV